MEMSQTSFLSLTHATSSVVLAPEIRQCLCEGLFTPNPQSKLDYLHTCKNKKNAFV